MTEEAGTKALVPILLTAARRLDGNMTAKSDFKSVNEYIASQPEAVRAVLERVRNTIRKAVPGAEETISYKMPTYRLHGDRVLYFAGWGKHFSLYAATDHVVAAFKDDLTPYQVNKGTIRFPLSEPVPLKLIERIAKFRAKEVAERVKAKAPAQKGRQNCCHPARMISIRLNRRGRS